MEGFAMQTKHVVFAAMMMMCALVSSSDASMKLEDSVIQGIAEAEYVAGATETPVAAIEQAKKLALSSFVEKTVGAYIIRRAQVQNTHLLESYLDFWSGANVRIDSVLSSRYWTEESEEVITFHASFKGSVSIPSSEIQRFKDVVAGIEREVAETLKAELLVAERAMRETEESAPPVPMIDSSELRAALEQRVIAARIQAEKLRLERIVAEEERKHQEAEKQQAHKEQLAKEQQAVAERLEALQDSVVAMRGPAQEPTSSLDSPLVTLREMKHIDAQIKALKEAYREELRQAILAASQSVNQQFTAAASAQKSEFETDVEFRIRAAKMQRAAELEQTSRFIETSARIDSVYTRAVAPFVEALQQLSGQQFKVAWQDLRLELGTYNPQFNTYPVSIRVNNPMDGMIVLCSAQIPIPREEAQVFQQHAEHDILRPELVGNFQTTQFFRVAQAYIIDDATNKQYDLFSSKFVDLGNGIVYDSVTRLLWAKNAPYFDNSYNREDANRLCRNLRISGLQGWRMPTHNELVRMVRVAQGFEHNPFTIQGHWYMSKTLCVGVTFARQRDCSEGFIWPVQGG